MKVAEYIADYLVNNGVKYIHGVVGGGAASLNDAFSRNKNLQFISYHHEQAAATAANGASKLTNKLSVCNVTTGPGGLNTITSLASTRHDFSPVLFISGNVNINHTTRYQKKRGLNLIKFGVQECDIIDVVKSLCKYSVMIEKPEDIVYELDKCINICLTAPFGPCWLDIPSDIQALEIDFDKTEKYNLTEYTDYSRLLDTIDDINTLKQDLLTYQKPLVLAGNGLHTTKEQFKIFIEKYQLPYVTTFLGFDLINDNHSLNIGRIGIKGTRGGNFALQNCDLLLILGCSLGVTHTGYDFSLFAPKARKYLVDLEKDNHNKSIKIDKFINCDLEAFFKYVN